MNSWVPAQVFAAHVRWLVAQTAVPWRVIAVLSGGHVLIEDLPGTEFVRRVLLHVLPTGIKRIRHYGVLAAGAACFAVATCGVSGF